MDDGDARPWVNRVSRTVRGISFQLIALLSVAILPVGAVSISQSLSLARESRLAAEQLLQGLTVEAAGVDLRLITVGLAASKQVLTDLAGHRNSLIDCRALLRGFIASQNLLTFAGVTQPDGVMRCTSEAVQQADRDFHDSQLFQRLGNNSGPWVDRIEMDPAQANWTLVTTQPIVENGVVTGFLSIALPQLNLPPLVDVSDLPRPTDVMLFNHFGDMLTSVGPMDLAAGRLPDPVTLNALLVGPDRVLHGTNVAGEQVTFAKVTLIEGMVNAVGEWPVNNPITRVDTVVFNAVLFPALMWIASMAVAYLAANRLVIVPIRSLRGAIRRFALGDRSFPVALPAGAPLELQQVASTFAKLEQIIGRNESGLAVIAEEKLLLLREVHHRIKNNLQMISSIINIQRRKSDDPDVRLVLSGLQDRVLSIALIDQSLYQNGNIWDVRADTLIQSITDRLISVNLEPGHQVDITIALEPTLLHADQIGPMSLLANEAVTNAMKYVGRPDHGRAFVRISLSTVAGQIEFEVVNSVAPDSPNPTPKLSSSNLGMPLIKAFSSQLGATCTSELDKSGQEFRVRVNFTPSDPRPDQHNALNY